ncbi:MAG TPA: bile acid:sodium symporter family protein [Alcanivoracaceae bacterium]|nr:bile acid:sodium symporter family protein [Alcanivoracaceae bacterium]
MLYSRLRMLFDNFTIALLVVIAVATFLPPVGEGVAFFENLTYAAIALLFFLHGAKLPRQAVIAGVTHWRLHLLIFLFTFLAFPILGLLLKPFLAPLVNDTLYMGVLFLCALPATVQSAIAFTAMARGNVAAAVASASASSLIGILLTPFIVNVLLDVQGDAGSFWEAVMSITVQLLVPFIGGQIARTWIGQWVEKHAAMLKYVDQSSILLVVYTAFGAAIVEGLWTTVSYVELAGLFVLCCILLAIVLVFSTMLARRAGFNKEDEITIVFCASKKSLATGVPMAKVIFPAAMVGPMLLPLMIFHQLQLMVCAVIAQQYAKRERVVD